MEEDSRFCKVSVVRDLGLLTSSVDEEKGYVGIANGDLKNDRSPMAVMAGGFKNVDCEMTLVAGDREVSVVSDLVLLTSVMAEKKGDVNISDNVLKDERSAETVVPTVSQNVDYEINVGAGVNMGGRKRKRGIESDEMKKEPEVDSLSRVLRPRSVTKFTQFGFSEIKENIKKKNKKRKRGRPRKKITLSDDEDWCYYEVVSSEKKRGPPVRKSTVLKIENVNNDVERLERKRRPLKKSEVLKIENVNNDVARERKRGRPRKTPLKLPQNNRVKLNDMLQNKGKVDSKNQKLACCPEVVINEKRFALKQSHLKSNGVNAVIKTTGDLNKKENEVTAGKDLGVVKSFITKKGKNKAGLPSKKSAKQKLRAQIKDMLLSAGWKIDYRPRNGRDYMDAVYLSPNGNKSLWSITLAYSVLKKQYEDGTHNTGFIFNPIPDEELLTLTKVTKKTNKNMKSEGGGDSQNSVRASQNGILKIDRKHKSLPKTQNKRRCALLVRNSGKDGNDYIPYCGKRTVLGWMIDLGIAAPKGKVKYMNPERTKSMLEGTITRDGIYCGCCNKTVTISEFETHSGSQLHEASQNICLDSGNSLLQCELDTWNKQCESERCGFHLIDVSRDDPNDDSCGLCGDGGELICCDVCPSAFHQSCLDIQNFPSGDWHCVYCSCKICGSIGWMDNGDVVEPASQLSTCHFCEAKYHRNCIQSVDAQCDRFNGLIFCGTRCEELSNKLQMLVGVKHELEDGFSCTFIRRSEVTADMCIDDEPAKIECNAMVAVAYHVMDECFVPIIDERSGINLIHNILFNCGSNINRLNFSGFITAILQRGDEIISAATIRIHGNLVAEMPFIGTRNIYRRQGMCRRLLSAIESTLRSLSVVKLVIPAIAELLDTWTGVFGFKRIDVSNRREFKYMNMLVFPGTDLLQKSLVKDPQIYDKDLLPSTDVKCFDFKETPNPVFSDESDNKNSAIDTSCKTLKLWESTTPCPILHVYTRHFRAREPIDAIKTEPMETDSFVKQDCIPEVSLAVDSEQKKTRVEMVPMETFCRVKQDCIPDDSVQKTCVETVPLETIYCEDIIKQECIPDASGAIDSAQKARVETEHMETTSCEEIVKQDCIPNVSVAIDCEQRTCMEIVQMETISCVRRDCIADVSVAIDSEQKTCVETEHTETTSCEEIIKQDCIPDDSVAIDCEQRTCTETEHLETISCVKPDCIADVSVAIDSEQKTCVRTEHMETTSCEGIIKQDCIIIDVSVAHDFEKKTCVEAEHMETISCVKHDCNPAASLSVDYEQKSCIETEHLASISSGKITSDDRIPDASVAVDWEQKSCIKTGHFSSKPDVEDRNMEICGSNVQFNNSESFCSLKSTSGVDFLSASGGSNACCIPEVG